MTTKLLIFFSVWISRFPNTTETSRRLPRDFLSGLQQFEETDPDTGPQWVGGRSGLRGSPRLLGDACLQAPRPAPGRAARLVVEILRHLEGPKGSLMKQLVSTLVRAHVIVQTSPLEAEPTLDALVRVPREMQAEPHATFPRVMAGLWMLLNDADSLAEDGWCKLDKMNNFLSHAKPKRIAAELKRMEPALSRARYIIEEFIHKTVVMGEVPLRLYPVRTTTTTQVRTTTTTTSTTTTTTQATTTTKTTPTTTAPTTTTVANTTVVTTTTRRFQPTRPKSTRSRTTRTRSTTEPPNLPVREQYIEGDDISDIYLKQLFDSFPEIHISDYHETHISNNQFSENSDVRKIPDKSNDPKIRRPREPQMRSRSFQLCICKSLLIFFTVLVL